MTSELAIRMIGEDGEIIITFDHLKYVFNDFKKRRNF